MSLPIRNILVATDFSVAAVRAADRAARLAREHGACLHLVHSLDDPGWMAAAVEDPDLPLDMRVIEDAVEQALARERQRLADDGLEVDTRLLRGPLHRALPAHLAVSPTDLLVLGAHGENAWRGPLFGSTAERMLHVATIPVLLVRTEVRHGYRRLAMATDFSDGALHAAQVAMAMAPKATPLLFHAHLAPFSGSLAYAGVSNEVRSAYIREASLDAMRHLEAFADRLGPEGRSTIPALREGPPARALSDFVAEAGIDLVALGAQGRSRIERHLLGSVSRHAAACLACDVLVVPGAED